MYFKASVYDKYLVCCEACAALICLNPGAVFKQFNPSRSTVPKWILGKKISEKICGDTQDMPQSRSTALPMHIRKER